MNHVRGYFRANREYAALLLYVALLMRILVPTGYMISHGPQDLALSLCSPAVVQGDAGQTRSAPDQGSEASGTDACSFATLALAELPDAARALAVLALAFIMASGFLPVARLVHARGEFFRPPLRAPPAVSL